MLVAIVVLLSLIFTFQLIIVGGIGNLKEVLVAIKNNTDNRVISGRN